MASREIKVTVPASSANLGPGFDTLGLALAFHDEVYASPADDGLVVEVFGEGAEAVPRDERHLVVRAMRAAFEALEDYGKPPPGIRLRCHNRIPHGRGLGSSAAASVAGAVAAAGLLGLEPAEVPDALLQVTSRMEGHADNAAAALLGGFVVAWQAGETYGAARLEPHAELAPVAFIAGEESATSVTRGLLPERVPLADAAFTASRTALGVCAFTTRPELLMLATEDRLHQPYRRPAYPASLALVEALRERGVPAVISGAGPTVLALPVAGESSPDPAPPGFILTPMGVDRQGAQLATG
ncbi:homoserine kinase [Pseudonocardia eucalypti]|uniref:Homoserine kinase n=1 Tax=Pseudonocardia eucalypti TaxID=648755 RepID=A0ABP9Q4Y5_9PSEU|nr:homoserine kinase [Pseudonocardia eucalypti]